MAPPTVCLTFDFDAVSPWLHVEGRDSPTNRTRGLFGAEVGAPRCLDFLAERDLPATWFVPGHTIDSFPEVTARVADAHEVGHHGWTHTPPAAYGSRAAERADIERGIESVRALTGEPPAGYRSPSWDYSAHTAELLVELGFEYSSSGMARDFRPYAHRPDGVADDGTYATGEPTGLLELPVSWHRDDHPNLAHVGERATRDGAALAREWCGALDWARKNVEDGLFVLTFHPQVIGREGRLRHLGTFVEHARDRGVPFAEAGTVAASVSEDGLVD
ncbi:MAG: polysaccharide deacetylase family protein [Haloarculaceae archaeon]